MLKIIISLSLIALLNIKPADVFAKILIIVNKNNNLDSIDHDSVKNIFLGKSTFFPNGQPVKPVNQSQEKDIFRIFHERLTGKTSQQLSAYWSIQIFSGRGRPPLKMDTNEQVLDWVSQHVDGIGYIDDSIEKLKDAKVISTINE